MQLPGHRRRHRRPDALRISPFQGQVSNHDHDPADFLHRAKGRKYIKFCAKRGAAMRLFHPPPSRFLEPNPAPSRLIQRADRQL